jgi:hypothetical protein
MNCRKVLYKKRPDPVLDLDQERKICFRQGHKVPDPTGYGSTTLLQSDTEKLV